MSVGSIRTVAGMAIMAGASGMVTAKAMDTARSIYALFLLITRLCSTVCVLRAAAVARYQFVFSARSALIGAKFIIPE